MNRQSRTPSTTIQPAKPSTGTPTITQASTSSALAPMGEAESVTTKLSGTVEVDETYVGGKSHWPHAMDNKTMVLGALERDGRVVFKVEGRQRANREILHRFIHEVVADEAEAIYTDSHDGYIGIEDENTRHESVSHRTEEWVRGDVHTNGVESVWSLLDRSIMGSFHQLSTKHLPAYLDEISFRFNNRENPYLFRDTLIALLSSDSLTYDDLTA